MVLTMVHPKRIRSRMNYKLYKGVVRPICPYCGKPINEQDKSRDHILTRKMGSGRLRGGSDVSNPDHVDGSLNIRICHRWCNTLKEHAGDCLGALACAKAVAEEGGLFKTDLNRRTKGVLLKWKLMYSNNTQDQKLPLISS